MGYLTDVRHQYDAAMAGRRRLDDLHRTHREPATHLRRLAGELELPTIIDPNEAQLLRDVADLLDVLEGLR